MNKDFIFLMLDSSGIISSKIIGYVKIILFSLNKKNKCNKFNNNRLNYFSLKQIKLIEEIQLLEK